MSGWVRQAGAWVRREWGARAIEHVVVDVDRDAAARLVDGRHVAP